MTPPSGHDLSGLIKWCARDDWRDRINAVMAEHFEPAMKEFGLDFDGFDAALGGGWTMTLWGCAFEDFLTRRFGPDSENPVEAYLRRRGWKEGAATRSYMAALPASVMSLYEVSAIMPGQSLRARDLIRGGEPILVHEHSATQTLKPWERIAARIISHNGRSVLGGGVLAFTYEEAIASVVRQTTLCVNELRTRDIQASRRWEPRLSGRRSPDTAAARSQRKSPENPICSQVSGEVWASNSSGTAAPVARRWVMASAM